MVLGQEKSRKCWVKQPGASDVVSAVVTLKEAGCSVQCLPAIGNHRVLFCKDSPNTCCVQFRDCRPKAPLPASLSPWQRHNADKTSLMFQEDQGFRALHEDLKASLYLVSQYKMTDLCQHVEWTCL